MKILHFCYDHPDNPWCGGGGAQRSWQINRLLARHHDITVCCGAFPNRGLSAEPFKLKFLGNARRYKESRLKYIWHSLLIDTRSYDLIAEDFSAFSPALFRQGHTPVVTVAHYYLGKKAIAYRKIWGCGAFLNEQLLLRRRKNIIVVSTHLQYDLLPETRVQAISPGVEIPADIISINAKSGSYVLFVGRLDINIKGLDVLIRAWSKIPDTRRRLPLKIIGDGDRDGIEKLIQQTGARDVQLAGRCEHADAMRSIANAAVVCIPSRMEGCGLVFYEALALGKPVIATTIPAFRDLAESHGAALLVKPGDVRAMQKGLEVLLGDAELRARLAERAGSVGRKFTWNRAAHEQDVFYRSVLARARNSQRGRRR